MDDSSCFARPLLAPDVGVQVVVPALSARLGDSAGHLRGDVIPAVRAEGVDEGCELGVLLL